MFITPEAALPVYNEDGSSVGPVKISTFESLKGLEKQGFAIANN